MEIERKYLVTAPPSDYHTWEAVQMEQAYLCTEPVVRVRRENNSYVLTYKSKGILAREEYNIPLTKEAYEHLLSKADALKRQRKRSREFCCKTAELPAFFDT